MQQPVEEVTTRKRKLGQGTKDENTKKEITSVKRSKDCFRCGGNGHLKIECISAAGAIDIDSKFVCFKCSGKGHYARDCPNLRGDICFVCGLLGHHGLDCPSNLKRKGPPSRVRIERGPTTFYGSPYTTRLPLPPEYGALGTGDLQWGAGVGVGLGLGLAAGTGMVGTGFPVVDMKCGRVEGGFVGCFRCGDTRHLARECQIAAVADETTTLQFPVGFVGTTTQQGGRNFRLPESCFRCGGTGHFFRECKLSSEEVPSRDACFKCGRNGHRSKDCEGPDKRVCFVCHKLGHVAKQCELPASLPPSASILQMPSTMPQERGGQGGI